MTILQQVANAVVAALNTGRPAGVPEAKLWTGVALEPADLPSRTIAWTEEKADRAGGVASSALVVRRVSFHVQDLVAGTGASGQPAQAIGEAYRAWTIKALVANRYPDGSGVPLAIDTVEVGTAWEFEQGEEPYCRCTHTFEISFTTRSNDAELRA